jgi:hypothetical protein
MAKNAVDCSFSALSFEFSHSLYSFRTFDALKINRLPMLSYFKFQFNLGIKFITSSKGTSDEND